MTRRRSTFLCFALPRALGTALVLALATLSGFAPSGRARAEMLDIVLGTQRRVALPSGVARLAVGDPAVTQVQLLTSRELLALGSRVGSTNVLLWSDDGRIRELKVRVARDLSVLQAALRDVHEGIRVSAAPDRDAVILRGTVPEVRYSRAAEDMARGYLGESLQRDSELVVRSADASNGPMAEPASGENGGNPIRLAGARARRSASVINLIRVEGLPPSLEDRIAQAIRPLGGEGVRIRRLVQGTMPNDEEDTFVLEGEVRGQVSLVRLLLAAARLVSGSSAGIESIDVLANEAGALARSGGNAGTPAVGLASIGGISSAAGGSVRAAAVGNDLSSNVARAKALSAAGGRLLAFIDVVDLPQVRLETRIYEVDRSRLMEWEPNFNILLGNNVGDDVGLLPSLTQQVITGEEDEPLVTSETVRGAISMLRGGIVSAGVQYVGENVAIDATFRLLEDASIARTLARPTLSVLSGEVARFNAGGQIPISVTVDTQTSAASDTLLSSTVFASFGVDIAVRPMVEEDDTITLDVSPSISRPDFTLTEAIADSTGSDQETTAFETRALKTTTRIKDGQSFMISGFLQSSRSDTASFTPWLHRVPLIGWLAKSQGERNDSIDFVIVVSPAIVRERTPRSELWVFPDAVEVLETSLRLAENPAGQGTR